MAAPSDPDRPQGQPRPPGEREPPSEEAIWTEGKAPASMDEFLQCCVASRIVAAEEIKRWLERHADQRRLDTPKALAAELVRTSKLTRYQAQAILQGKLKYLVMGEYQILEKLGQGGMGQVFKAEHRRMRRTVALKVMSAASMKNADAVRRFQREVHAAARLIHPNIVTAFDANEHRGIHYFVMEYVEGQDLGEVVRTQGRLPTAQAIEYVLQVARGLAYAHSKGIVHRDIKPGNLLLDREGTVKILDMGLARIDFGIDESRELTNTGQVMGTIDYMAPEQAEDTHSADARADIYSLGCTLYRLVVGDVLYGGDTAVKKLLAHRAAAIPSLRTSRPDVSADIDALFQRMVAKRPEDRPASMARLAAELEALIRNASDTVRSRGSTEATQDIKLTEFLAELNAGTHPSFVATAKKPKSKSPSAAFENTVDLKQADTNPAVAGIKPVKASQLDVSNQLTARPNPKSAASSAAGASGKRLPNLWLLAGAAGGFLAILSGIILYLSAGDSTVRVEINDPSIEVTVAENGYKIQGRTEEIHLTPGEHTLHVKVGELEFDTQQFVLGKGENPALRVDLLPGSVQVVQANGLVLGQKDRTLTPAALTEFAWRDLFNSRDLQGWQPMGFAGWSVVDGVLVGETSKDIGWLRSQPTFDDFELRLEYQLPPGGNSGVFFRAPETGEMSGANYHEVQLLDDTDAKYANVSGLQRTGSLFGRLTAQNSPMVRPNQWARLRIRALGDQLTVHVNDVQVLDGPIPPGKPTRGHIGFQLYAPSVRFRNIQIREL